MGPSLSAITDALGAIAPLAYAEDWDNVGLLVEPPARWDDAPVERALVAIDLTEAVLAEALEAGVRLVVAYHPPIFGGLKRLTRAAPLQRVVLRCVAEGVAVYSPHTALDATTGGLNDWLVSGLGPCAESTPLVPHPEIAGVGAGRLARLASPTSLPELVARLKVHLGLDHVRVAAADPDARIAKVAVCPGAGGALFATEHRAELYVTGEMRHHDVLAKVATGAAVVLTDHTNTERGYLPTLARRLSEAVAGLDVRVSTVDRDPLQVT